MKKLYKPLLQITQTISENQQKIEAAPVRNEDRTIFLVNAWFPIDLLARREASSQRFHVEERAVIAAIGHDQWRWETAWRIAAVCDVVGGSRRIGWRTIKKLMKINPLSIRSALLPWLLVLEMNVQVVSVQQVPILLRSYSFQKKEVRSGVEFINKLLMWIRSLWSRTCHATARNGGRVQHTLNLKSSELQCNRKISKNPRETAVHELKDPRHLT